jgi:hypothetical protein
MGKRYETSHQAPEPTAEQLADLVFANKIVKAYQIQCHRAGQKPAAFVLRSGANLQGGCLEIKASKKRLHFEF